MTKLSIKGLSTHAATSLEPYIRRLYDDPRGRTLAVVEFEHVSRTEPGPASDAAPKVDVRISLLEVPSGLNQDLVRVLLRSLYLLRTARGTLDEASGAVSLETESARIADAIPALFASEAAEARAVLHQLLDQFEAAGSIGDPVKHRRRLQKLVKAGRAFLGTGDRELLNALAQDQFDLSDTEPVGRVEVDVEADDRGGPVRVADVVADVVPDLPQFTEPEHVAEDAVSGSEQEGTTPARPKRSRARKTTQPAAAGS